MGAPTGEDGLTRAVEFVLPSAGVIIAVALTKEFLGGAAAGLIYLLLWGVILFGIYTSATYWNISYTASFVVSGAVLWIITPGVISEMIHPVFGVIGSVMGLVFFMGMVVLLVRKAGLDDVLSEL
ncbi:hypothetical protein GRX01_01770 [Halobaculum sp. WSA2]|uniref:DUF8216 domain-containing protein n=1 Tax=Halobaculum saliterrae TaxID=2073113 RepID=A0A6B0T0E9_9EURY|nr:hypothetical protein [Halobaculum saliterrae]MXR40089.1 hypothetical protein [Halobaculum saliterrae]